MEGLIPFVYNVIVQYRTRGGQSGISFGECTPTPYVRLAGDSGRFTSSSIQLLLPEYVCSSSSSSGSLVYPPPSSHQLLSSYREPIP
ncbi:conserved hypothetical protein [Ricinus communis]|uniref:Uncharacterized protein n=1 Tax=Ricinus communis TaxID=3988 RepID=B9S3D5_RICCO|nr:conserved hypothetical protein [Ricinus communis]